jgi:hypothetical protein
LGTGVDGALAEATAASLRRAAAEEAFREAVRTATAAAVGALHGVAAALLARIEGAQTEAAKAAWFADARPTVEDIAAASDSPQDAPLLRAAVSFKLTGMSQTTRSGTEAPVPPLGAHLTSVTGLGRRFKLQVCTKGYDWHARRVLV